MNNLEKDLMFGKKTKKVLDMADNWLITRIDENFSIRDGIKLQQECRNISSSGFVPSEIEKMSYNFLKPRLLFTFQNYFSHNQYMLNIFELSEEDKDFENYLILSLTHENDFIKDLKKQHLKKEYIEEVFKEHYKSPSHFISTYIKIVNYFTERKYEHIVAAGDILAPEKFAKNMLFSTIISMRKRMKEEEKTAYKKIMPMFAEKVFGDLYKPKKEDSSIGEIVCNC
ncbi:MAG: hypothetical protein AB7V77_01000 [Candidatus Woesearchaeota archaeon]